LPKDVVYLGDKKLTDKTETPLDAGKLVLSPTRTYAPVMKKILGKFRKQIHGIVHCSGGGQTKVLHFINQLHVIKDNLFPIPPLFQLIQEQSKTDWKEMYQVFNMGHRMEIYLPLEYSQEIINISKEFSIDAQIIGRCEKADTRKLTITSQHGIFQY
jgi:phosphoribosylformylglycinamidine cyclo-ligase